MSLSAVHAKKILARFSRQRILVVGDLMLDRYVYGGVSRISPEAPVPVVHVTHEKSMPGGASNVAWNVRSLGGRAAVSGILGRDATGRELKRLLTRGGVLVSGALEIGDFRTTVKERVIAERQQVVRVDRENNFQLAGKTEEAFCRRLASEVGKATGVIIEDYGKGVIQQRVVDTVLASAKARGLPIGLDPKENHELGLGGITVATPNRKEAFAIAGVKETAAHSSPLNDKALLKVAGTLMKKWAPAMLKSAFGNNTGNFM